MRDAWVLLYPASDVTDVDNAWYAHCLDFDVLSHGRGPKDAIAMVLEALLVVLQNELAQGRDPFALKPAPEREWKRLWTIMRGGTLVKPTEIATADEDELEAAAVMIAVAVAGRRGAATAKPHPLAIVHAA